MPKFTIVNVAAFAIGIGISSQSIADDLYIWDSRGRQVGTQEYGTLLRRQIKGAWYDVNYFVSGFEANAVFYYQGANCTGQRFIYSDGASTSENRAVQEAFYEDIASSGTPVSGGHSLWSFAPGGPQKFKYGSFFVTYPGDDYYPQGCANNAPPNYDAGVYSFTAVSLLESETFAPPFCASLSAVRCH